MALPTELSDMRIMDDCYERVMRGHPLMVPESKLVRQARDPWLLKAWVDWLRVVSESKPFTSTLVCQWVVTCMQYDEWKHVPSMFTSAHIVGNMLVRDPHFYDVFRLNRTKGSRVVFAWKIQEGEDA